VLLVLLQTLKTCLGLGPASRDSMAPKPSGDTRSIGVQAFFGACLLTAALLLPHVSSVPVIAGMFLAGLIRLGWRGHRW